MRTPDHPTQVYRRLACLAALMTTTLASAQVSPPEEPKPTQPITPPAAEAPASATKEQKLPTQKEVTAAAEQNDRIKVDTDETLVLSPFEVSTAKDQGYRGASSMSGTRMGADLDDIANPISVVTKQQLLDMAARDINDIFASELSVEGTRTYTANFNDGKADVDSVSLNPETANRVRGLGAANISVGNFAKSSTIPIDVYNVDAVEISRGPNSSIFGMGEASGTVNLVPSSANITKDFNKISLSYSSFDTKRGTIDLNRVLWKNKLALRVNALQNNQSYLRKPSYDKTRRYQFSLTAHPFKYTTIRASYENFRERYSRPNSSTPREYLSLWEQNGRPSWNPATNIWDVQAHTDSYNWLNYPTATGPGVPGASGGNPAISILNPAYPAVPVVPQYIPYYSPWLVGLGTSIVRPVLFIDQGRVDWAGTGSWSGGVNNTTTPASTYARRALLGFGLPTNYAVPTQFIGTLSYSNVGSTNNKSFYDYETVNLAAINRGAKDAETTRVEIEQFILNTPRQVLAAQVGFFKERIMDYRRNFIGNGGDGAVFTILPDVNRSYPDGTPNPHYGAPYIGASPPSAPQTYMNPIDTRTYRANIVYQLDLSKEKNLLRFLGKTKILGYAESFDKTHAPKNIRYLDAVQDNYAPWLTPARATGGALNANGIFNNRYYIGDGKGNNVDYAPIAPADNNTISYHRWGSTAGEVVLNDWYTVDGVKVAPSYFSQQKQQLQTTTRGFIAQNYLLKDRVITTYGWRRDTLRTRDPVGEPASAKDPITNMSTTLSWMDDYTDRPWFIYNKKTGLAKATGDTKNFGLVVKPARWVSLRYNQSTSFKPEEFAIDFLGEPLQNSGGKSKDYGVSFNLFNNKLNIGVTRFETFAKDSRTAAGINTIGSRVTNLDYDLVSTANGSQFDLEDWLIGELGRRDGLLAGATPTQAQTDAWTLEAHSLMGLTEQEISDNRSFARALTADTKASGYELTLDYNPNAFLSIKVNGSRAETINSNIGPTWQAYRDKRMATWTTIQSPDPAATYNAILGNGDMSRIRWWTSPQYSTTTGTPNSNWIALNQAPMSVFFALQGKPVPQNAKYKGNFLARYRVAQFFPSTPFLKDVTIGGKLSWIDKSVIGFYAADPVMIPDPNAANPITAPWVLRSVDYDINRPIYVKAQTFVDMFATYDFRMFKNRIRGNVQLNVRNITESGRLQPYNVNPNGTYVNYRIVDPREFIVSVNFDL